VGFGPVSLAISILSRRCEVDPATGAATLIGDFATSGSRSFTPPTAQDWVLVLDNAALNLTAPGQ